MFCLHIAVDPEIIARGTVGFSGAELENLVNQAALKAAVEYGLRADNTGKNVVVLLPDTGDRYLSTPLFAEGQ